MKKKTKKHIIAAFKKDQNAEEMELVFMYVIDMKFHLVFALSCYFHFSVKW